MMTAREAREIAEKVDVLADARQYIEWNINREADKGETHTTISSHNTHFSDLKALTKELEEAGYGVEFYTIQGDDTRHCAVSWYDEGLEL